jgi:hypothetical protein
MQIVKSNKFTPQEANLVDLILKSLFKCANQNKESFDKDRALIISKDASESPDFVINIEAFTNPSIPQREKMFQLFDLYKLIFKSAEEPRVLINFYSDEVGSGNQDNIKQQEPVNNIVDEIPAPAVVTQEIEKEEIKGISPQIKI